MNLNTAIRISRLDAGPVLELARMKKPLLVSEQQSTLSAESSNRECGELFEREREPRDKVTKINIGVRSEIG